MLAGIVIHYPSVKLDHCLDMDKGPDWRRITKGLLQPVTLIYLDLEEDDAMPVGQLVLWRQCFVFHVQLKEG